MEGGGSNGGLDHASLPLPCFTHIFPRAPPPSHILRLPPHKARDHANSLVPREDHAMYYVGCAQDTGSWDTAKRRRTACEMVRMSVSWTSDCARVAGTHACSTRTSRRRIYEHLCNLRSYFYSSLLRDELMSCPGTSGLTRLQGGRACAWGARGEGSRSQTDNTGGPTTSYPPALPFTLCDICSVSNEVYIMFFDYTPAITYAPASTGRTTYVR